MLVEPRQKGLRGRVMMHMQISVGDHGPAPVPAAPSDDVHRRHIEGVGGTHDRADIEVVLPVLDRNLQRQPAGIQVGHDRFDAPVAVAVGHIAVISLGQEFRIKTRIIGPGFRMWPDSRAAHSHDFVLAQVGHGGHGTLHLMHMLALLIPLMPTWLDPAAILENLIQALGNWALWGVAFLVFIECAIWPILPGDSLLFTVGMFISYGTISFAGMSQGQVLAIACLILTVAAVAGNVAGYWLGHLIGPPLFKPREGFWGKVFNPVYVDKTHEMLAKYGNKALVLGRFVPFVRTFITLIAGIGRMPFKTFITWTAVGGVIWAVGVTVLGFYLGQIPFFQKNIEAVLIAIVFVSVIPMIVEALIQRRKKVAASQD